MYTSFGVTLHVEFGLKTCIVHECSWPAEGAGVKSTLFLIVPERAEPD